ncbi:hypothetical protein ACP4J4_20360 (plasmid) [Aureimonas ureilytica]|uniref:hypothetical protein n=1 Tax=Aureimonas ureilytica TaxID=401562 RepID=UPI003CF50764
MSNRTVPATAEGLLEITTTTTDPMLGAIHELRIRFVTHSRLCLGEDAPADAYKVEKLDPIRKRIIEDKPLIETEEGARGALYAALTLGVFIDPLAHALVLSALTYLEGRAAR